MSFIMMSNSDREFKCMERQQEPLIGEQAGRVSAQGEMAISLPRRAVGIPGNGWEGPALGLAWSNSSLRELAPSPAGALLLRSSWSFGIFKTRADDETGCREQEGA